MRWRRAVRGRARTVMTTVTVSAGPAALCLTLVLAACGEDAAVPLPDLATATYVFPESDSVSITMSDGEGSAMLEGAADVRAGVTDWILHDDIDEDGSAEAVVVVWSSGEGDVTLYEVALLEVVQGPDGTHGWAWRASHLLGDRVRVRAMTLASDVLGVHLTRHGPDDEMCCPTEEVELRLRVGDGSLTEVGAAP